MTMRREVIKTILGLLSSKIHKLDGPGAAVSLCVRPKKRFENGVKMFAYHIFLKSYSKYIVLMFYVYLYNWFLF